MSSKVDDWLRAAHSMAGLRDALHRAAASASPILLVGPPGSGRSSLARALHLESRRESGPIVEVDPSTVPTTLFESELFGHRPGAFTGAEAARAGRVERAARGTLLFDHVEELPLAVQPKLLRLLAEGRFAPLGGNDQDADVRILATASPTLLERMRRGRFREDLYYRLEVLAFTLAPLAERREDIEPLAEALLDDLRVRYDLPPIALGSPSDRIGAASVPVSPTDQQIWGAIAGPNTPKQQGDPYATSCAGPTNSCTQTNLLFRPDGYWYALSRSVL